MKYLFLSLIVVGLLMPASQALAHWPWIPILTCGFTDAQDGPNCTFCSLFHTAQHALMFMIWIIAIPVATIGLLIGGILMIISGGNEKLLAQGKQAVTAAGIGLIIVSTAWAVVNTIIVALNSGSSLNLSNWFSINCR